MSDLSWASINTIPESQTNWATTKREPKQDLDRNAFLNLLITQLQHQDPLNPMDDRDFIAQMAQFSALEQMMNLNETFERTQAFGMIGKVITASFYCPTAEENIDIEDGLVASVVRRRLPGGGEKIYLSVAGENGNFIDVPFDAVTEVTEAAIISHQLNHIYAQVQGHRAADLIGMVVQGFEVIGDRLEFVEGKVDAVTMRGDIAILVVGRSELEFPHGVFAVSDRKRLIGSPHFTHGPELTGVEITNNDRAYLLFSNGSRVYAERINIVTDALNFIGEKITSGMVVDGVVEAITMVGGVPFFETRMEGETHTRQVNFLTYLEERATALSDNSDSSNTGGGNS